MKTKTKKTVTESTKHRFVDKKGRKTIPCFISRKDIAELSVPLSGGKFKKYNANIKFDNSNMVEWPTAINPRTMDLSTCAATPPSSSVEKKIFDGLIEPDIKYSKLFHMKNRGGLLFVDNLIYDDFGNVTHLVFESWDGDNAINGLADGLTTAAMMLYAKQYVNNSKEHGALSKDDNIIEKWYYPVEIIVGCKDKEMIRFVVESRNTFHEVEQHSLANYDGIYDDLKKHFSHPDMVSWHERDKGDQKKIGVKDLLCEMYAFLPRFGYGDEFGGTFHKAHNQVGQIVKEYRENPEEYNRVCLIISDIHKLTEFVESELQDMFKISRRKRGRKTDRDIFAEVTDCFSHKPVFKRDHSKSFGIHGFKTKMLRSTVSSKLILSIVHAHRCITELNRNGMVVWKKGYDPIKFFKAHGPEIVGEAFRYFSDFGNLANRYGKEPQAHLGIYFQADKFVK